MGKKKPNQEPSEPSYFPPWNVCFHPVGIMLNFLTNCNCFISEEEVIINVHALAIIQQYFT